MFVPKAWPFLLILLASSFCWPLEAANSDSNANLTIKKQKETVIEDMKMQEIEAEDDAAVGAGCPTNNYWMVCMWK
jgi:hypothetical protein